MMTHEKLIIRSYEGQSDRAQVEDLERRCEVGPSERIYLFTDTMGDPICRIRHSPMYMMLVAELDNELVGIIQGSIKVVTIHSHRNHPNKETAKAGYILGLRVSPLHRRKGIGTSLVGRLEEWFTANEVDYSYMATEKDNLASVRLFIEKLGYIKFRTPSILVNPVNYHPFQISPNIEIVKLKVKQAEFLYRRFMGCTDFFPQDIDRILKNKLTLGTWVAYFKGGVGGEGGGESILDGIGNMGFGSDEKSIPNSWAMLSVWNSGELFKLRLGKAPWPCLLYTKSWGLIERIFPCFKLPCLPDFFNPFGFYFMYGVYNEGPSSGKLVRSLCHFVHNMAARSNKSNEDEYCKVIVTEVGGRDGVRHHIPHWKLLSSPEDLWCIKALRNEGISALYQLTKNPPTRPLFVDPREV